MGAARTFVPKRLLDPQQEEEEPEGIDNEQFLSQLAGTADHFKYSGFEQELFWWHKLTAYTVLSKSITTKLETFFSESTEELSI